MCPKRFFLCAGEDSGDIHGARLITEILKRQPNSQIVGLGGRRMASAGMDCRHNLVERSAMWFLGAVKLIPHLRQVLEDSIKIYEDERPDLVILIDYPGFNFYLAKHAKEKDIPVMYYIAPQIWAYGYWRIKKIKKLVDRMVVILPFEEKLYSDAGIPVTYVGHPLFDGLLEKALGKGNNVKEYAASINDKRSGDFLIGLLPGSRRQEINGLMPLMSRVANLIKEKIPSVRFAVCCVSKNHENLIQENVDRYRAVQRKSSREGDSMQIVVGDASEIIQEADLCLAGSGTITLELLFYATPTIILYQIPSISYFIGKPWIKTKAIGLVNVLANENPNQSGMEVMPEFFPCKGRDREIAECAMRLLTDEDERNQCTNRLIELREKIAVPGASAKAAEEALKMVNL